MECTIAVEPGREHVGRKTVKATGLQVGTNPAGGSRLVWRKSETLPVVGLAVWCELDAARYR